MRALAPLLFIAVACSKATASESLPLDQVAKSDIDQESDRVRKGEDVGRALATPTVQVESNVIVNDRQVVAAGEIDLAKVDRIKNLHTWLAGLRAHWEAIHPGATFHGIAEIKIGNVASPFALAVLGTIAAAGFGRAHVKAEGSEWEAPISSEPLDRSTAWARVSVDREKLSWVQTGIATPSLAKGGGTAVAGGCKSNDEAGTSLERALRDACDGPMRFDRCFVRITTSSSSEKFGATAKRVAPAFSSAAPANVALSVVLGSSSKDPCSDDNDEGQMGNPNARSDFGTIGLKGGGDPNAPTAPWGREDTSRVIHLREGPILVRGTIAPEHAAGIVRRSFSGFRICYERALEKNEKLAGDVTAKLAIDTKGSVTSSTKAASDMKDEAMVACVLDAFKHVSFAEAASTEPMIIVYTLRFSAS